MVNRFGISANVIVRNLFSFFSRSD